MCTVQLCRYRYSGVAGSPLVEGYLFLMLQEMPSLNSFLIFEKFPPHFLKNVFLMSGPVLYPPFFVIVSSLFSSRRSF